MKKTPRPFAILGAGNAATALAMLLARHKRPVNLYCIEPDVERDINLNQRNAKYLPGIELPRNIRATSDAEEAVRDAEIVVCAVPSHALEEAFALVAPFLAKDVVVASVTKGLHETSLLPLILHARDLLPRHLKRRTCLIAGPAIATELAEGKPAGLVIAGEDRECTKKIASYLRSASVKAATMTDLLGVGYAMALKNVYAIAIGMCDGLKFPMNAKAFIISHAMDEMAHILERVGAERATATSLAGLGDLLVTGLSPHGRNRTYGERLVGATAKDPKSLGLTTVEGIQATRAAMKLVRQKGVEAPLLQTVARCLNSSHHFERPFIAYLHRLQLD